MTTSNDTWARAKLLALIAKINRLIAMKQWL